MNDKFDVRPSEDRSVAAPRDLPLSELQLRVARENPRDERLILQKIQNELNLAPHYASEMFYALPFKNKKKKTIVFARGIGIEGSQVLFRHWGNSANSSRVGQDLPDRIMCQGYMFDYETGGFWMREVTAWKYQKTRQGGSYRLDPHRLQLAVLANQSRAVRNATLAGLPTFLKETFFDLARYLVINPPPKEGQKPKSVDERLDGAKGHFMKNLGAKKDEMDRLVQAMVDANERITPEEILENLIGLNNCIKDNQVTIDYVLFREGGDDDGEIDMPEEMVPSKTAQAAAAAKPAEPVAAPAK